MDWQFYIYGSASPSLQRVREAGLLTLHSFTWQAGMRRTGLIDNAIYLIRPDGHIAFMHPAGDAGELKRISRAPRWLYRPRSVRRYDA